MHRANNDLYAGPIMSCVIAVQSAEFRLENRMRCCCHYARWQGRDDVISACVGFPLVPRIVISVMPTSFCPLCNRMSLRI